MCLLEQDPPLMTFCKIVLKISKKKCIDKRAPFAGSENGYEPIKCPLGLIARYRWIVGEIITAVGQEGGDRWKLAITAITSFLSVLYERKWRRDATSALSSRPLDTFHFSPLPTRRRRRYCSATFFRIPCQIEFI